MKLMLYYLPAIRVAVDSLVNLFLKNPIFMDIPTDRSNHETPRPKGAGIILIPLILFSTSVVFFLEDCFKYMKLTNSEAFKIIDNFRPDHLWHLKNNSWERLQELDQLNQ